MLRTTTDRLREHLAAEVQILEDIYAAIDNTNPFDDGSGDTQDPYEALSEAPVEVTIKRTLRVVLATGGPHVEAVATLDDDGDITDARLMGFWSNATIDDPIDSSSAVYRLLEQHAEGAQS